MTDRTRTGTAFSRKTVLRLAIAALIVGVGTAFAAGQASALSELKPLPGSEASPSSSGLSEGVPLDGEEDGTVVLPGPEPLIGPGDGTEVDTGDDGQVEQPAGRKLADDAEFLNDIEKAPQPVRRMRQLIMEAAASGDPEKLRPLINPGPNQTQLLLGGIEGDPVEVLSGFSGDPDGLEILAILLDVLSADFARINAGTPDEMYVWPVFAEKPIGDLTAPEKIELMRIVTAGDFAEMQEYGNYNFFRVGISPEGEWKFFLAGD